MMSISLCSHKEKKLLKQNPAFFYQNDGYGRPSLAASSEYLKERYRYEVPAQCKAPYSRNTLEVNKAKTLLEECGPDSIFLFSTPKPSEQVLTEYGIHRLSGVVLFGLSFLTDRFRDFITGLASKPFLGRGIQLVLAHTVPSPDDGSIEIVKHYQREMTRVYPGARLDADSLEGYINASLLIAALEKIEGAVTHEKLMKHINTRIGEEILIRSYKYSLKQRQAD